MRFKIDLASLIIGRKFTVFALLFYRLCFALFLRAISKYKPSGGLYLKGRFNGGFFCVTGLGGLYLEGLIFGILRYLARTSEQRIGSGIGKSSDSRTSPPKNVCTKQR